MVHFKSTTQVAGLIGEVSVLISSGYIQFIVAIIISALLDQRYAAFGDEV